MANPCFLVTCETEKSRYKKSHPKGGFCDPAGARTQDPNIKSVVLYQLSYGISAEYFVLPQGLEPWTPTLRVSCSTN